MDCKEIVEKDVLERYLHDELSDPEQDAFEHHYFECKDCFEHLQIARAIQEISPRGVGPRPYGNGSIFPVALSALGSGSCGDRSYLGCFCWNSAISQGTK